MRLHSLCAAAAVAVLAWAGASLAGVVNPDISVIGQPFLFLTNAPDDANRNRLQLDVGETEFVFDAYLNPYARGTLSAPSPPRGSNSRKGTSACCGACR